MIKGIIEVLQTEMLDFTAPVLINNLPSIDGLLCSQRQVIWGMKQAGMTSDKQFYKMLKASGRIFDYYVLGDIPLCGVMKNMGNNYILNKYLMPKGSFGNKNLRDGSGSAPRYIECKLDKYSEFMLEGIKKNAVTMKKNYDSTESEPVILPSKIPNILTNCRMSISVSESNKMPSHNMNDTCDSLIHYLKTNDMDKSIEIIKTPDLPSGGSIIYNKSTFYDIYKTGRGSFINIGKHRYDEKTNTITIYEIPYTTYIENIEDELEKNIDKFSKELADYHNGSDKDGLKLELYLKKNVDINVVMQKLRKFTSYESKFACNFTILDLDGKTPKLMSLQNIYDNWIFHRINCIKNETLFDMTKNAEELNRLYGLKKINEDLDIAIKLIRSSKTEKIASENLINHFNLNQKQGDYIATIRLLNINQEWIDNKINNIDKLEEENTKLEKYYNCEQSIKNTIISQLEEVKDKFGKDRLTEIIHEQEEIAFDKSELVEDYNPTIILTNKYIKKTRKYSETQKLTDDDSILQMVQCNNKDDILLFTNQGNCLTRKVYDLQDCLPSEFGTFMQTWLGEYLLLDEKIIYICTTNNYKGDIVSVFKNGKVSKTSLSSYKTKTNRQVSQQAYNTDSELIDICLCEKDEDILFISKECKGLISNLSNFNSKGSRNTTGDIGMKIAQVEDNEIVFAKINPKENLSFIIKTQKGKSKEIYLNDIAENSQVVKTWYDYLKSQSRGVQGNFIINTRTNNDKVTQVILNK